MSPGEGVCPMRLNALSAGVEAPTRRFSGVIHSIFHQACNVSLESDALLTLVSSEKGTPSQGIRLGTPPQFTFLDQLRVGQSVACRGGILRISGSELSVDLRTASLWHIDLKGLRIDLHQRDRAQAWTVAWLELGEHRRGNGISAIIAAIPVSIQISRDIARDKDIGRTGGPNRSGPDRCDKQPSG